MYDEQIKIKADGPSSQFVTESVSPAFIPRARVVSSLRNSYSLLFIFRSGKSLVLPTMQRRDVVTSKLIGHRVKQPCPFQVQS